MMTFLVENRVILRYLNLNVSINVPGCNIFFFEEVDVIFFMVVQTGVL